jgi:sugar (glycoside-pentoside-hexuronide) transporter
MNEKNNKKAPSIIYKTTRKERVAFGVFGIGGNIFFVLVGYFLQQYYLVEAAVPAAMLGVVFLIVKIWDAVNDPMFGVIVDRARLKKGKYLPWIRVATCALPLTAMLLFFVPFEAANIWKAVFILVAYAIFDMSSTVTEVPYFAITTAMTDNPTERSQIISNSKFISTLPALVILFVPVMYTTIGWRPTMAIFAFAAFLVMLPGCFIFKERYDTRGENPPKLKEIFDNLFHNKYLLIFFFAAILYGLTNTAGSMSNLFAIYNLGSDSYIAILILVSFVPGLLAILCVKILLNRADKIQILCVANAGIVFLSILMYLLDYKNFAVFAVLLAIRGFAMGVNTMMFFLFTPDFAEYGTYATGAHTEGITFSIQSFASKVIGALASVVSLGLLSWFGFVSGSEVQSEQAMHGIWLLVSLIPAIGAVLQIVVLKLFYKLRDRDVAVMSRANHGEITAEEANRLLGGKYRRGAVAGEFVPRDGSVSGDESISGEDTITGAGVVASDDTIINDDTIASADTIAGVGVVASDDTIISNDSIVNSGFVPSDDSAAGVESVSSDDSIAGSDSVAEQKED